MYEVLVADSISNEGLAPLLEASNVNLTRKKVTEVEDLLHTYDALLVRSATTVTEDLLDKMKNLKIVARAGVGVDNIDIEASTKRGVVVINAPNGNTISTAEHTFAMMASLVRHIPQGNISVKSREWNRSAFVGTELNRKHLGIVGFGRIGSELAKRAKAFNMTVHVYDPFLTTSRAEKLGVDLLSLDDLLAVADIITVHTPLTKDTKGLLNRETLAKTKKGVYLLNCARGGIIDEEALAHYLEIGHVQGAAIDVFEVEPPTDNPLLNFDQVITTPHLGASTKEAQLNVAEDVAYDVLRFLEGNPVSSSINLPTLSKDVFEKIQPFTSLTKQLGAVLSQCMKEPVQDISVTYAGTVADLETTYITRSLLSGFLTHRIDRSVNEVNASMIAKERGITFGEKISDNTQGYANIIEVVVKGESRTFSITGTYIKDYGPRVINIDSFDIDFYPEGHLLYIRHIDQPGVIGNVGKALGDLDINIATMQVGRKQKGGEAIMMLTFDRLIEDATIESLKQASEIVTIQRIEL
ncbi:phosphoglycerate dehydrogenase [Priestia flexa]|uniref:phosphoglycerate dehydrogenase n=1 Tax=Priestia flexa TaxID=86664 RepID=UPI0010FC3BEB|nr:phosphoglycerate dehydrogenase [Priestia flexa]QCS52092.1 phosphoglycerate dehydrogenase [Priestia flexa]